MKIKETKMIKPTYELASQHVHISMYGKPTNWSLKHLEDSTVSDIQKGLLSIGHMHEIQTIYAPNPSRFNAHICEPKDLTRHIFLDHNGSVIVHRGCYADGVVIPKKEAMFISSADCPTVIIYDKKSDTLIAAHAGLECLIDKQRILFSKKSRSDESVINAIFNQFTKNCEVGNPEDWDVFIACGIKPKHFVYSRNDSVHGKTNDILLCELIKLYGINSVPYGKDHGGISLEIIIRTQLKRYGVREERIQTNGIDTYENNEDGECTWHSHARFVKEKQDVDGRNGIFIVHK